MLCCAVYECSCGHSATTATAFYKHLAQSKESGESHQLVQARFTDKQSKFEQRKDAEAVQASRRPAARQCGGKRGRAVPVGCVGIISPIRAGPLPSCLAVLQAASKASHATTASVGGPVAAGGGTSWVEEYLIVDQQDPTVKPSQAAAPAPTGTTAFVAPPPGTTLVLPVSSVLRKDSGAHGAGALVGWVRDGGHRHASDGGGAWIRTVRLCAAC